jgi:hypothetical protein
MDLICFLLRDILRIGVDERFEEVFVFVNDRLKLVFFLVEFFDLKVSESHLLLFKFHIGKFRK